MHTHLYQTAKPASSNATALNHLWRKAIAHHRRQNPNSIRTQTVHPRAAPQDVFALDFDGVLIDSEPEVSASAFAASEKRWPSLISAMPASDKHTLLAAMRRVRPVLVRGHESMVMLRVLVEDLGNEERILSAWPLAMQECLAAWQEDEQALVELFESTRNTWMTQSSEEWMLLQRPYQGVVAALKDGGAPFYVVSSKAGKRVSALAQVLMGLDLPADSPRLYASLLPPEEKKAEALRSILARPLCADQSTRLHFVDDRLDTLTHIRAQRGMERWQLYLADWGYCTREEKAEAAHTPGIRVIGLSQFCELLRFGLLMGVDDGCEPTPEEVQAGLE